MAELKLDGIEDYKKNNSGRRLSFQHLKVESEDNLVFHVKRKSSGKLSQYSIGLSQLSEDREEVKKEEKSTFLDIENQKS